MPLRPQEYYYLYSPWFSSPNDMFTYAVQGLWFDGHISISFRNIYINQNDRRKRRRMFIKLGPNYRSTNVYPGAEKLILSHLSTEEERLYMVRRKLWPVLEELIANFKHVYVWQDVDHLGLCLTRRFLNAKGRYERKVITNTMDALDEDIDSVLKNKVLLQEKILALGANVIFLNKKTLQKLNLKIDDLDEVSALFDNRNLTESSGMSYGAGSYGGFSGGGSSGGFGGYGGGGFGGGGSGGTW